MEFVFQHKPREVAKVPGIYLQLPGADLPAAHNRPPRLSGSALVAARGKDPSSTTTPRIPAKSLRANPDHTVGWPSSRIDEPSARRPAAKPHHAILSPTSCWQMETGLLPGLLATSTCAGWPRACRHVLEALQCTVVYAFQH
jgi:hypothetical protein